MTSVYIKFESQTQGEKARSLLSEKGIKSHLKRNPNPNHRQGCGFALFVSGDTFRAFEIIEKNGIKNLGVESYRERL